MNKLFLSLFTFITMLLLSGCAAKPVTGYNDPEYGEDEVRVSGDTIFWRGKELGFLLTQQENKDWVVLRMEKSYDRYSLWKKVICDSLPWGSPGKPCQVFESKISNVKYNLLGVEMEHVLQYGEKYVYEIFE